MRTSTKAAAILIAALSFTPALTALTYAVGEPAMIGDTDKGKAWVDTKGMALYTFDKDAAGKSNCNDKCAAEWPPLPVVDGSQPSGDWTIIARDDGSKQWAFKGKPLYTFVDDKQAGKVTGDGDEGFHLAKAS